MSPQGSLNLSLLIYRSAMALLCGVARLAGLMPDSASLKERLGFYPDKDWQAFSIGYNIWLHAASATSAT